MRLAPVTGLSTDRARSQAAFSLAALDQVSDAVDAPVATVALAWLLTKRNVVAPVVTATAPDQVIDLTTAAGLRLTRHQLADLDRASSAS